MHNSIPIFKNPSIHKLYESLKSLPKIHSTPSIIWNENSSDGIHIQFECSKDEMEKIHTLALSLKPWRKGPFYLNHLFIDSEWRSFEKWNTISNFVDLKDKSVADVGCNNGYFLFEMLKQKPKRLIGFDPSELFYTQFCFLQHFINAPIEFEKLGIESLLEYGERFDVIFCLGVLYHRSDPIRALKNLSQSLQPEGSIFLDTLVVDWDGEIALCPKQSYARMKNVYFIPSIPCLEGWCLRSKLEMEILALKPTTTQEQRKTSWTDSSSLQSFLSQDQKSTIEGYPPPKRGYFKLKRSVR